VGLEACIRRGVCLDARYKCFAACLDVRLRRETHALAEARRTAWGGDPAIGVGGGDVISIVIGTFARFIVRTIVTSAIVAFAAVAFAVVAFAVLALAMATFAVMMPAVLARMRRLRKTLAQGASTRGDVGAFGGLARLERRKARIGGARGVRLSLGGFEFGLRLLDRGERPALGNRSFTGACSRTCERKSREKRDPH